MVLRQLDMHMQKNEYEHLTSYHMQKLMQNGSNTYT